MRFLKVFLFSYLFLNTLVVMGIDFHVWVDEYGVKHVSMIPPEGYDSDGNIKDDFNPNSIVYQYKYIHNEHEKHADQIAIKNEELISKLDFDINYRDGSDWIKLKYSDKLEAMEKAVKDKRIIGGSHVPGNYVIALDRFYNDSHRYRNITVSKAMDSLLANKEGRQGPILEAYIENLTN